MASQMPFERVTNKALGELLVERGVISRYQCDEALAYARQHGKRIGEALVELGFVPPGLLSLALGEQFGTTPLVLDPSMVDVELVQRFPLDLLRKHRLLPLLDLGGELIVAVGDPNDAEGLEAFRSLVSDRRLVFQLADALEIERCLSLPQLAHSPSPPQPLSRSHVAAEPLHARLTEFCRREPERWLMARIVEESVEWWTVGASGTDPTPVAGLSLTDSRTFYECLDAEVQWLRGAEHRVGFLEAPPEGRLAVVGAADLNGVVFTFRWLRPWQSGTRNGVESPASRGSAASNQATSSPQDFHPLMEVLGSQLQERLIVLRYTSPEVLGTLAATYAGESSPPTLLMATAYLPWLYPTVMQLPASGMWMVSVVQSLGLQRVFCDHLPAADLLSALLLGCPRLKQVVVAIPGDRWNEDLLNPWLAACEHALVDVADAGWRRFERVPNDDAPARR